MEGETRDTKPSGQRLDELTRRTADDVSELAHEYAGVAKREAAEAGERALWPAATAAIGAILAAVGVGVLFSSPAVPGQQRRLKRRMRGLGFAYVVLGGLGLVVGGLALARTMGEALPRTRRGLRALVDELKPAAPRTF